MLGFVFETAQGRPGRQDGPAAMSIEALRGPARAYDSVQQAMRDGCDDVVLVRAPMTAMSGWAQQLVDAAAVDDRVATVSAIALPDPGDDAAARAARVRDAAVGLRPALAQPAGPCVLLRRDALQLVGWPGHDDADRGVLAAFAAACTAHGLLHVLADDLLVFTTGEPDGGGVAAEGKPDAPAVSHGGPLARVRSVARGAVTGLSVTVDARLLDGPLGGSQVHTLALIRALAECHRGELRVMVGSEPRAYAQAVLDELGPETLTYEQATCGAARTAVVHRPTQVFQSSDIALLRLVGERIVVTHEDSILFHNPAYFAAPELWHSYRRVTSRALAEADRVVFSTEHARADALRDELVAHERSAVVALGTDHRAPATAQSAPPALPGGQGQPFLLCLGSDLLHKNRPFAIRLVRALRGLGWDGRLVLAGGHAEHGSSAAQERELLDEWPQAADGVVMLGHVSEHEREWLTAHCAALVFASVSEGFGLPPFEAARRGVPCLFAARSAMAELLPAEAATLVPWDAEPSAAAALVLLTDATARERHLKLMRGAAEPLTWKRFAGGLIGVYEQAASSPARAVSTLLAHADEREQEMIAVHELAVDLRAQLEALGPDALRLVGRDGLLPADVQRALLAAVARRPTQAPLFALLRAGYRAGHRG